MKVFLHVGHGKTGSSYIQKTLALNTDLLRKNGLYYPEFSRVKDARDGEITSGNFFANEIIDGFDNFAAQTPEGAHLLFSSEFLFKQILDGSALLEFLQSRSADVQILLFIRNPVAALPSHYSQAVKRDGFTGTIDDYIEAICAANLHVARAPKFLELCEKSCAQVTVRNYDRHKTRLISVVETFLRLPDDCLKQDKTNFNRSLSRNEIEFVRQVNAIFGKQVGRRLSDRLCIDLPGIVSDPASMPQSTIIKYLDIVQPLTEWFDSQADGHFRERYDVDFDSYRKQAKRTDVVDQVPALSPEQATIVRTVLKVDTPPDGVFGRLLEKVFK